jgi:lysophospholipase L1-like esterase
MECRRVVAFGDSLTADPGSWAEVLELVNLGVPGDTTVHLISRFAEVAAHRPDLLIVMAGTNDARRHGSAAERILVPDPETKHNLELLITLAREQTRARVVFITPPPILEDKVRLAPILKAEPVTWLESDVSRKAEIVAGLEAEVIDSRAALTPPIDRLLLPDGLHLSRMGHERLARLVVHSLALHRRV